jgi:uncharacterized membrane protein
MTMLAVLLVLATSTDSPSIEELRQSFDALECERVLSIASSIEASSVRVEDKREARFRRGYCLAVIGNVAEAGTVFQQLFEEDLAARAPFAMEPRVQYLVDVARSEVKGKRDAAAAEARRKLVERITLNATPPPELRGGRRAFFVVTLDDPDGTVRSMRVDFRKRGEPEFYALPVRRQPDGSWRGEVPGSYTKSAQGTTLEWFVTASDEKGERLTSFGARETPQLLEVLPGSVVAEDLRASERLGYATRAVAGVVVTPFATAIGVILGIVAGGFGYLVDQGSQASFNTSSNAPIAYFGMLLGSGLAGIAGNALVNFALLDEGDALWATAVVALVFVAGVTLGTGWFIVSYNESDSYNLVSGIVLAGVTGFVACTAGAIVTPLFVLNDPPQE